MLHRILTINGGSSTIEFTSFALNETPERILTGQVERIGLPDSTLSATDLARRALKFAGVGVRTIAETFLIHLRNHALHAFRSFRCTLRQQGQVGDFGTYEQGG